MKLLEERGDDDGEILRQTHKQTDKQTEGQSKSEIHELVNSTTLEIRLTCNDR